MPTLRGGPRAGTCPAHPAVTPIPFARQDRLIALDAAEEFFRVASAAYPKRPRGERADGSPGALRSGPAAVP